jgi:hypothetical protein
VTGCTVEADDHSARIIAWERIPDPGAEMQERRIVIRFAMPMPAARALKKALVDAPPSGY